jgi:hypothetical protein
MVFAGHPPLRYNILAELSVELPAAPDLFSLLIRQHYTKKNKHPENRDAYLEKMADEQNQQHEYALFHRSRCF